MNTRRKFAAMMFMQPDLSFQTLIAISHKVVVSRGIAPRPFGNRPNALLFKLQDETDAEVGIEPTTFTL